MKELTSALFITEVMIEHIAIQLYFHEIDERSEGTGIEQKLIPLLSVYNH